MPNKVDWLMESSTSGVVKIIMEEEGLGMVEAMKAFFSTELYEALNDKQTGLYLESPSYLYELYRASCS